MLQNGQVFFYLVKLIEISIECFELFKLSNAVIVDYSALVTYPRDIGIKNTIILDIHMLKT